jgi:uncharacterized protein
MYPFGSLPENLTSFCGALRREHGFHIGAGELLDAARALEIVDLSNEQAVRSALRTVLACTRDDVARFDEAFDRFFLARHDTRAQDQASTEKRPLRGDSGGELDDVSQASHATTASSAEAEDMFGGGVGPITPLETGDQEVEGAPVAGARYSPIGVEVSQAPEVAVDEAWLAAARVLVRRLQLGPSRKWRAARKGQRFDVRRTLRASLQTGSEPLSPRWLARARRQPRFVVVVDGSRSMSQHAGTALKLAAALMGATPRVEVFTFSTTLQRVTTELKRALVTSTHRLPALASAWGGGTTIGQCLAEFLRRFGNRLLSPNTVVIVASDGLDVGDPERLRLAMQALRRRAAALVWLNPLLGTPGYEPTALGMRIAKPFVTTFASVNDLSDLVRLSRTVHLRS